MTENIVLGIDPGTGRTGWGIVRSKTSATGVIFEYIAHGCISTDHDHLMQNRLLVLHAEINSLIEQFKPQTVIIEQIFFGRNMKTAISVSQARGVVMLSAAKFNLPIFEYTPSTVKLNLTGSGKAEKKEIQQIVRKLLNTNSRKLAFNGKKDKDFDDSADALAIAMHHAFKISGTHMPPPNNGKNKVKVKVKKVVKSRKKLS